MNTLPFAAALITLAATLTHADDTRRFIVRVTRPERTAISETVVKTGSMEAPAVVDLLPKVSGRLIATTLADGTDVVEGTPVRKGDSIARIDPRDHQARLTAAEAVREHARASLDDAVREFDRTEALLADGSATEQEADRARAARLRAEASLQEAEARVTLARIDLEETEIRAPFDGRITARLAHTGAMLSPATPIYTIQQMDPLRLFFHIPTTTFAKIVPGTTPVAITVDAYPGETLHCVIRSVHPAANATTRTVKAEMHVANPDGKYLPGMYARGEIALDRRENVLVVPRNCLINVIDTHIVYTVVDGRAVATTVTPGIRQDDRFEIIDGLSEADVVITLGHHRLTDGVRVQIESGD